MQVIVDALRAELARRPAEPDAGDRLRAKLKAAEAAAARIADALEKAPASETLLSRLAELEEQARKHRAELAKADAEARALAQVIDPVAAGRQALDARLQLEQPDFRSRQLAVRGLVQSVRAVRLKDQPLSGEIDVILPGTQIVQTLVL